jgi:type I restriction enzyme, S subunit
MQEAKEHITTKLVPQLRFKEFDGEWLAESFGKYVLHSAFGPRFSSDLYQKDGGIATLRTTDMDLDGNICYETMPFAQLSKEDIKDHILEENDIVISRSGTIGITGIFKNFQTPVIPGAFLIRFRIDTESVNSDFIKQKFNSPLGRYKLNSLSAGGVQKNLTGTSVKQADVVFPSLPEQQKIASFLSAVDEKVQQLTKKMQLLERYKKGVMQQLFSGQLRFKDENGNPYPDWEEKRLGEIGFLKNGLNKDKKDFGFGSPFVNLMDVFGKSEIWKKSFGLVNSNDKEKELYSVLKGDVLFIRSSVKRTGVGEAVVVNEDLPDTVYSGFLIRYRDQNDELVLSYKKYCFSSQSFRKELLSYATSSANTNINQESLNKLKVNIPSLEEQQKIATYLSSIDTKIDSLNNQITQTQTFKKGLLQQMFV